MFISRKKYMNRKQIHNLKEKITVMRGYFITKSFMTKMTDSNEWKVYRILSKLRNWLNGE